MAVVSLAGYGLAGANLQLLVQIGERQGGRAGTLVEVSDVLSMVPRSP